LEAKETRNTTKASTAPSSQHVT